MFGLTVLFGLTGLWEVEVAQMILERAAVCGTGSFLSLYRVLYPTCVLKS